MSTFISFSKTSTIIEESSSVIKTELIPSSTAIIASSTATILRVISWFTFPPSESITVSFIISIPW